MSAQRKVKLFRNGRNQAVRIPREFELPGNEAVMRREGDRLVIESRRQDGPNAHLMAVLAQLTPLSAADDFPDIPDSLPEPVKL